MMPDTTSDTDKSTAGNPSNSTSTDPASSSKTDTSATQPDKVADILRVAPLPPNPYFAFVDFKVGKYDFTRLPPRYLQEFSYTRVTQNGGNKFEVTLFDETAIKVEYQIAQGYKDVKFRYGYVNGETSKIFTGTIVSLDVDFNTAGAVLKLNGISSKVVKSTAAPKSDTYEDMLISDIVKKIATEEKWEIGNIVETKPVSDGEHANKTFTRNNQSGQVFITNDLLPLAKSADTGDGDYQLSFEDTETGSKVNFQPKYHGPSLKKNSTKHAYEFAWGSGDRNSRVIGFNPEYKGMVALVKGAGKIDATAVDIIKNQMFTKHYDNETDPNRTTLADKSNIDGDTARTPIGISASSEDEMATIAATMWLTQANNFVKATLTILGDPNINPYDLVSMVMLNKDGYAHHTSGAYMITEVTDSISGGKFTTTIQMQRNAMHIGVNKAGGIDITIDVDMNTVGSEGSSGANNCSGDGNGDIVSVALKEEGYKEGDGNQTKYGQWFGADGNPWCAYFVAWCANQAGISTDIIPKVGSASQFYQFFSDKGQWHENGGDYYPVQGDIIIFGDCDHVGIVTKQDGSNVYTIEGNTDDMVAQRQYSMTSSYVKGYGHPNYNNPSGNVNVDTSKADNGDHSTT